MSFLAFLISSFFWFEHSFAQPVFPQNCTAQYRATMRLVLSNRASLHSSVIENRIVERAQSLDHFLSESEFSELAPNHPHDSRLAQTWVPYEGTLYEVRGYDSDAGMVSISKKIRKQMTKGDLLKKFSTDQLHIGNVLDVGGEKYEVTHLGSWHEKEENHVVDLVRQINIEIPLEKLNFEENTVFLPPVPVIDKNVGAQVTLVANHVQYLPEASRTLNRTYWKGIDSRSPFYLLAEDYSLSPDSMIEVRYFQSGSDRKIIGKDSQMIRLRDYPHSNEREIFSITAHDPKDPSKKIATFERAIKADETQGNLVDYVNSHVYHFDVGAGADAKRIKVVAPVALKPEEDKNNLNLIKKMLGNIPEAFKSDIDIFEFDPGGLLSKGIAGTAPFQVNGRLERTIIFYRRTNFMLPGKSTVESILSRPPHEISETVWHELSHLFEDRLKNIIPNFDMTIWDNAIANDGGYISKYAETQRDEDFAETILHYIRTRRGTLEPELRVKFKNRFELLDRLIPPT